MRILLATITYPPALGGQDLCVQACSEGLQRRGHQVTVFTTDLEQPMSRRRLTPVASPSSSVQVYRCRTWRLPRIAYPFAPGIELRMRKTEADLIHAHCVWHSPALFAWRESRRRGIPLILNTVFSPRRGRFWQIYLSLVRRMIAESACVVAYTEFERNLLIEAGLHPKRLEVIPPAVDLSNFERRQPSILGRFGLEGHPVILSLGRLAPGKRVDRLIDAFPLVLAQHPEARLIIVGPDYGSEAALRLLVESKDLGGHVIFAGTLQRDDIAPLMQSATIFAMTTDFELFGIVLIEAMAAGTAVVAPRNSAVPEVVCDGRTGLLYDSDGAGDLTAKINRLLADNGLRSSLVDAAKEDVRSRFCFETSLDRLESLYREFTC
jgi:glycosyltransferase involved in cell wall biosynthesis